MGGIGSGGSNRLSDEEKKARGTFRKSNSDQVYEARAAAKVVSGPWLSEIPKPELPLNELGEKKYNELARILFDNNALTTITRMQAETAAMLFEKFDRLLRENKSPSASDLTQYQRALAALGIAENAPTIASPGAHQKKFSGFGFSARLRPPQRVR